MSLAAGSRFGPYVILGPIGSGGMGEVYRARDPRLDREVAVKVLADDVAGHPDRLRRFEEEARAVAALNHPGLLAVFDVGTKAGRPYIVSELLEGETLRQVLSRGPLPLREALELARQVAAALSAAHEKGVVHRDLKPDNLFLTRDGRMKILDFGLARRGGPAEPGEVDPEARTATGTRPGTVLGTVGYMSPEQVRGEAVDPRADIFAFGCVLYEMLSGRRAFKGATAAETMTAILKGEPPPALSGERPLPPTLERVLRHCLEKNPERRFHSAHDLALALDAVSTASAADTPPGTSARAIPRWLRRLSITSLAMLLLATASWLAWQGLSRRQATSSGAPRIESLAVLPLEDVSGDPAQEYFADGMTDALITELAKIRTLRVTSRTSVMSYKKTRKPLPEIARELGVDALVGGSVLRQGERVRITAQLVLGRTDQHLWAEGYERDVRDALGLQREVALAIAREVRAQVTPEEARRLGPARSIDPKANEAYLRGLYRFNEGIRPMPVNDEEVRQSISSFQEAIRVEPRFAEAWSALATAYHWLASGGELQLYPKAKAAALEALAIDETVAEAHRALAFTLWRSEWDWTGAEREFRRALELNPSSTHWGYALFLWGAGRHTEAVEHISLAERLDPAVLILKIQAGGIYQSARLYDRALEQHRHVLAIAPDARGVRAQIGMTLVLMGRCSEGLAELRRVEAADEIASEVDPEIHRAWSAAVCGERTEAERLLRRFEEASDPRYDLNAAIILAVLGRRDAAFARLERAYRHRDDGLTWMLGSPFLDPIRSDPRFRDLAQRVGIPATPS